MLVIRQTGLGQLWQSASGTAGEPSGLSLAHVEELLEQGRRLAERVLRVVIDSVPAVRNLREALEHLGQLETQHASMAQRLKQHERLGLTKQADYDSVNIMGRNLRAAQVRMLIVVRSAFADQPRVLEQLPVSVPSPLVVRPGGAHLVGLGNPVVVAAGAGLAAWQIALICLAVLASIGAIAYLVYRWGLDAEATRDIAVYERQADAYNRMLEARRAAYEDCLARGGTPQQCGSTIPGLYPTPEEAGVRGPPAPDEKDWIKWLVVGGVTLGALGIGYYVYRELTAERRMVRRFATAGARRLSSEQFAKTPDRYGLMVR